MSEALEHEQNKLSQQPIRPSVFEFAEAMELVLEKNDHKGGWTADKCTESYLRARLIEEMGEYFSLVAHDIDDGNMLNGENLDKHRDKIKKELIDIANFVMMLWDRV